MNSTPTGIITADYNGVELITTQRQSFAVAEEHDVQAVMARMEANEVVTDAAISNVGGDQGPTPNMGVRDSPKRDSTLGTQPSQKNEARMGNASVGEHRQCVEPNPMSARLAEPACRAIEIGSPGVEMLKSGAPREDEVDIDHDVAEYLIDEALRLYDVSGHLMKFVTIIKVPMRKVVMLEGE
ncbi:unnamed protein product [Heligmosomoides polygyrus]|uniref:Retrotransposon protein n=1 Tax=Heligmosomoides polygyrus TaxID=6339 RepID=A0A183FX42_HELPZ|nr:unnamed protein product [Heligmosomoides polygyrus]